MFFFSSRRRHTRLVSDWSSDVCSSDLGSKLSEGIRLFVDRESAATFDRFVWRLFGGAGAHGKRKTRAGGWHGRSEQERNGRTAERERFRLKLRGNQRRARFPRRGSRRKTQRAQSIRRLTAPPPTVARLTEERPPRVAARR